MNLGKRKSEECHYCENQHKRKRCKLAIGKPNVIPGSETMLSNFKCRGRGGQEIVLPTENPIHQKMPKIARTSGNGENGATKRNLYCNPNFKPQLPIKYNAEVVQKHSSSTIEKSRFAGSSGSSRSEGRRSSGLKNEIRISKMSKLRVGSSLHKFPGGIDKKSGLDLRATEFRSASRLPVRSLRDSLSSDVNSSSGSSITCAAPCKSSKKRSSQKLCNRDSRASSVLLKSLRSSSESIQDYLKSVSEELQKSRLLGNFDRPNQFPERQNGRCVRLTEAKSKSMTSCSTSRDKIPKNKHLGRAKSCYTERTFMTDRSKSIRRDVTFWARLLQLFSLGCWKTDIHSDSPSENRKSEDEDSSVSGSNESTSSESGSTSTGTTTVAAVTACGRLRATTKSDDGKVCGKTRTAKTSSSKSSGSGDHKLMAAKLVESLKRFFSRHRQSDSERPFEDSESSSNSCSTTAENSERSSSAPLNPKKHSQNQNSFSSCSRNGIKSKPECELVEHLLGDTVESPLSTENETSDAEIVDVCPMHKLPL